jgi:hypothetical protein
MYITHATASVRHISESDVDEYDSEIVSMYLATAIFSLAIPNSSRNPTFSTFERVSLGSLVKPFTTRSDIQALNIWLPAELPESWRSATYPSTSKAAGLF